METSILKSALKNPDSGNSRKSGKVTFCNTVKLFIEETSGSTKEKDKQKGLKCLDVSIVDKSFGTEPNTELPVDDCNDSDFMVHKVVYDNYVLPDDDLDIHNEEDSPFLTELDDNLEFVVHKVLDHQDGPIKNNQKKTSEGSLEDEISKPFKTLSIENILEHDKLIAFFDQTNLCLPTLDPLNGIEKRKMKDDISSTPAKKTDAVLSPPLQELSLDNLVKAHSDNVLSDLDISPLNSIQETDSDSDISSNGTMIMMTTEESEKNEQHIRESLLQYQSMKEKLAREQREKSREADPNMCAPLSNADDSHCISESEITHNDSVDDTLDLIVDNMYNSIDLMPEPSRDSDFCEGLLMKRNRSSSLTDSDFLPSNQDNLHSKYLDSLRRASCDVGVTFTKSELTSIEIPRDVRDWKIPNTSPEKIPPLNSERTEIKQRLEFSDDPTSISIPKKKPLIGPPPKRPPPPPRRDELEDFVHSSSDRVERIRKRYNSREKLPVRHFLPPSHRSRPRFGSTAEILQLMQKQTNPPFASISGNHHMSWPCRELPQGEIPRSHSYASERFSQSSFDSYSEDFLNSSGSDFGSISSCPPVLVHERGTPEGASPPRYHRDSYTEQEFPKDGEDSYVYYSLKV